MGIFTKDNFLMTKEMETAHINIPMAICMMGSGKMTKNKVLEL